MNPDCCRLTPVVSVVIQRLIWLWKVIQRLDLCAPPPWAPLSLGPVTVHLCPHTKFLLHLWVILCLFVCLPPGNRRGKRLKKQTNSIKREGKEWHLIVHAVNCWRYLSAGSIYRSMQSVMPWTCSRGCSHVWMLTIQMSASCTSFYRSPGLWLQITMSKPRRSGENKPFIGSLAHNLLAWFTGASATSCPPDAIGTIKPAIP